MKKQFMGVTIAVKDLDAAFKKYEAVLGVKPNIMNPGDFAFPGIKGGFFKVGDVLINIMSSDQPETSIYKFLETRGDSI
jgi:catechol 2,3-dioxygenase-like lactoylglutathione lyase family enzyme